VRYLQIFYGFCLFTFDFFEIFVKFCSKLFVVHLRLIFKKIKVLQISMTTYLIECKEYLLRQAIVFMASLLQHFPN